MVLAGTVVRFEAEGSETRIEKVGTQNIEQSGRGAVERDLETLIT